MATIFSSVWIIKAENVWLLVTEQQMPNDSTVQKVVSTSPLLPSRTKPPEVGVIRPPTTICPFACRATARATDVVCLGLNDSTLAVKVVSVFPVSRKRVTPILVPRHSE